MDANEQLNNLAKSAAEYKEAAEVEIKSLKATIARLGRNMESIKPFVCKNITCKNRKRGVICPHCGAVIK